MLQDDSYDDCSSSDDHDCGIDIKIIIISVPVTGRVIK
jgi:hypothetical protein